MPVTCMWKECQKHTNVMSDLVSKVTVLTQKLTHICEFILNDTLRHASALARSVKVPKLIF
jgi:hypothetical protein